MTWQNENEPKGWPTKFKLCRRSMLAGAAFGFSIGISVGAMLFNA